MEQITRKQVDRMVELLQKADGVEGRTTDQKLYTCAIGILCKDCMRDNGMIFV